LVEVCILMEESGRALLPGPLLPHTIATLALSRTETFDGDLVRAMATGEAVAGAAEDLGTPVACGAVADVVALLRFREPALLRAGTFEAADVEAADLTRPAARITPLAEPARLTKPVPLLPVACVTLAAESA